MKQSIRSLWNEYRGSLYIIVGGLLAIAAVQGIIGGGSHPLLGEAAPDFDLPLLEGGDFSTKDHIGKEVLVLDFWATWCPPCRKGLPVLDRLAKEYQGRKVAFYAVNQMETPGVVSEFVNDAGLTLPVLVDVAGTTARLYEVSSIPQTVIIGLDGRIQQVHVGISWGFEDALRQHIEQAMKSPVGDGGDPGSVF